MTDPVLHFMAQDVAEHLRAVDPTFSLAGWRFVLGQPDGRTITGRCSETRRTITVNASYGPDRVAVLAHELAHKLEMEQRRCCGQRLTTRLYTDLCDRLGTETVSEYLARTDEVPDHSQLHALLCLNLDLALNHPPGIVFGYNTADLLLSQVGNDEGDAHEGRADLSHSGSAGRCF